MTTDSIPTACRRAAALLVHHQRRDVDGCNATCSELRTSKDSTELVMGLLTLYELLLPELRTPAAIAMLADFTARVANREAE